jgi:hypothetical protein
MDLADPHDVACNVTTPSPPGGRFASYEGVEESRFLERPSTREPIVMLPGSEPSPGKGDGAPKRLFAKQPL